LLIAHVLWCVRKNLYILLLFLSLLVRAFGDSAFILDGHYNFAFYFFFVLASRLRLAEKQASPQSAHADLDFQVTPTFSGPGPLIPSQNGVTG
jgi:hypothetical protein